MFAAFAFLAQANVVIVTPDNVDRCRYARRVGANLRINNGLEACKDSAYHDVW